MKFGILYFIYTGYSTSNAPHRIFSLEVPLQPCMRIGILTQKFQYFDYFQDMEKGKNINFVLKRKPFEDSHKTFAYFVLIFKSHFFI